ncbi:hypothetical protein CDD81_2197 [Ophiocordyceps australis]|uniref:5'-Nucleotidase C-terminal domain-containing protein n=1 Tax=Ophiocordyceps australis TaxID=1399860 RepID=A0A2C5X7Q0_9HYPO|nr:hypothetical protein CDD81_2197 [Ophiocordyceps australis]
MEAEKKGASSKAQATCWSGRDGSGPPHVRMLHYNDVYHVDQASAEPVGGLARFMTLVDEYRDGQQFQGQPELLTLFSGDAFNPSLESTVTKGRHMVHVLNAIKTDCACAGNHDFDFGVEQFRHLTEQCNFPWLLANVLDPALGKDVPMGNAKRTHMMTMGSGIKVGLIGLVEREWLATLNSLPPNVIYKSATATAQELVPQLRQQGADIVICLSHMREPNDNKLAEQTDGLLDLILGGHDHYYNYSFIKGTHVLRSGSDFKQLSYIEARKRQAKDSNSNARQLWDFDIWRRDVTSEVPEKEHTAQLVAKLVAKLESSLSRAVGWTATPLDARFSTVRLSESNMGNFVCDVMRSFHGADCALMASGTIRGDQIYPPGVVRIKDITNCFPFEDGVILLRVKGQAIRDALENGVSTYPALEGRFPQVSNISFEFNPDKAKGSRITSLTIGGQECEPDKSYTLATRGYMGRGKDGYESLLVESKGGKAQEIVDEENGILLSAMLRQYFMSLRTIGQWKKLPRNWKSVTEDTKESTSATEQQPRDTNSRGNYGSLGLHKDTSNKDDQGDESGTGEAAWRRFLRQRLGLDKQPPSEDDDDDHFDPDKDTGQGDAAGDAETGMDLEILLLRKFWARWVLKAGVKSAVCDALHKGEYAVDWTRVIAPTLEGRIKMTRV